MASTVPLRVQYNYYYIIITININKANWKQVQPVAIVQSPLSRPIAASLLTSNESTSVMIRTRLSKWTVIWSGHCEHTDCNASAAAVANRLCCRLQNRNCRIGSTHRHTHRHTCTSATVLQTKAQRYHHIPTSTKFSTKRKIWQTTGWTAVQATC